MTMTKVEKTLVILATVAVLLLVALAFATPANGETYTAPGEPTGQALLQADPEANKVSFWCEPDDAGVKYEPVATPFVVPPPPEGKTWTLLVMKSATDNETVPYPVVGQGYTPVNGHANSHVILCWEDEEVTTTTSSTTTSSTTTSTSSTTSSTSTTTTLPATTTTDPGTTTSSSTTTTVVDPTTTSSSVPETTTTAPSSTVPPTTTTDTLPKTGLGGGMAQDWRLGGALVAFGLLLLFGSYVINRLRGEA